MITIILCGKQDDTSVLKALLPTLSAYGGVTYIGMTRLSISQENQPKFLLCDYIQFPEIHADKGLIFFKNSFSAGTLQPIPSDFLCVFESHNHAVAALLKDACVPAVTCGLSAKDTLTFSSFDYDCATVSLQRCITTMDGKILEPHEIPVKMNTSYSPRQTLAVCMTLLISGMDSSQGYCI